MLARRAVTAARAAKGAARSRSVHATDARAFLVRGLDDVRAARREVLTEDGALQSRRYLVRGDDCGFSIQHEVLKKGATLRLTFSNHVYAVLVTRGAGRVQLLEASGRIEEGEVRELREGSLFALNAAEVAELAADSDELEFVSVMNPPLFGAEERLDNGVFPVVDADGIEHESYDHTSVRRLFEVPSALKGGSAPLKDDPLF